MSNESKARIAALNELNQHLLGADPANASVNQLRCLIAEIESLRAQLAVANATITRAKEINATITNLWNQDVQQLAARVPDGCVVADVGFRWDGERQHYVPKLVVEFEPVPENSPWDAKGWKDRDAVAAMISAAPSQQAPNDAAQSVDETNAVLASRYFDLLKVVEAYEKHGVTCQTFRHFVDAPCAECNCTSQQAPVQGEPVGYMNAGHVHELKQGRAPYGYVYQKTETGASVAVFTHPQQASEPMTEEQAYDLFGVHYQMPTIRAVERFHKIGEKQ